jgi:hypothetical protein
VNLKTAVLVIDLRGLRIRQGGSMRLGAGPGPAARRRNCPPRTPLPLGPPKCPFSRPRGRSPDRHDLPAHVAPFDDQPSDCHRQAEPAGAGAPRVEPEHAIALVASGTVRVSRGHKKLHSSCESHTRPSGFSPPARRGDRFEAFSGRVRRAVGTHHVVTYAARGTTAGATPSAAIWSSSSRPRNSASTPRRRVSRRPA